MQGSRRAGSVGCAMSWLSLQFACLCYLNSTSRLEGLHPGAGSSALCPPGEAGCFAPEAAQEGVVTERETSRWWGAGVGGGDALSPPLPPCCCRDWPRAWGVSCCRGLSAPRGPNPPGTTWWETRQSAFRLGIRRRGCRPNRHLQPWKRDIFSQDFSGLDSVVNIRTPFQVQFLPTLNFPLMYVFKACHL